MQNYIILPGRRLPMRYLTYKSTENFEPGQLVQIPVRQSREVGLVIQESQEALNENIPLKEINDVISYRLSKEQMQFLFAMSNNTMNPPGLLLQNFYQPLKLLTQKRWKEVNDNYEISPKKENIGQNPNQVFEASKNSSKTEFIVDLNISVRIMYLIRSLIDIFKDTQNTHKSPSNGAKLEFLLVFPEKKYLHKILSEVETLLQNDYKDLSPLIELSQYTGTPTKESKNAVWDLVKPAGGNKFKLIFTTRSGLFLPFQNLSGVFLIDEANSLHIQDQNSVYFDARDAVFLLANYFNADLFFISTLPSIRLHNFYSEKVLDTYMTSLSSISDDGIILNITERNAKYDKNSLISDQFLEKIKNELNDESDLVFTES